MWKQIETKEIYSNEFITILEDTVQLPNGKHINYIKFKEIGNGATIVCKRADGKILLPKEFTYPANKEIFMLPGGMVPLKEDIQEGANRELMEEVGYKANSLVLLGNYYIDSRRSTACVYAFLATDLVEESLPHDVEESIQPFWFTEDEIDHKIANNEIMNAHSLAVWTLYKTYQKMHRA